MTPNRTISNAHSFCSVLRNRAATLNSKLEVIKVSATFRAEIPTLVCVSDNMLGSKHRRSDYHTYSLCLAHIMGLHELPNNKLLKDVRWVWAWIEEEVEH